MENSSVNDAKKGKPPPPVFSGPPSEDLEEALKKNPHDPGLQADVGSDESMDASDPPSAARPDSGEPAPSSGYRE